MNTPLHRIGFGAMVLAPILVSIAAIVVAADGSEVVADDVVRLALVVGFAAAGWNMARRDETRRLAVLVLSGLAVAAIEFLTATVLRQTPGQDLAEVVRSFAAPLVLAIALHGLAALPDGRLTATSTRWLVGIGYVGAGVVGTVRWADRPEPIGWPLLLHGSALAIVGVVESRRAYLLARGSSRQRMQWVGLALALVIETAVVVGALDLLVDWPPEPGLVVGASLVLVAVALAAASTPRVVGRVDRMLSHTVSLAGLTAVVVAVYLLVVVGLGRVPADDERSIFALSMLAAAVASVLYVPARARLSVAAARLVYGELQDPTQALDTFGSRMTRALPMEELLLQLVELAKKHFSLRSAEVWTGVEGRLSRAASVPDAGEGAFELGQAELAVVARASVSGRGWAAVWLPEVLERRGEGALRIAPMTHAGQLFGLLVLERKGGDDDFSEDDDRVLTELARQVGLALQNSELDTALQATLEEVRRKNDELRESRARIVASGDFERRKIERNLHDGAQQHLVALAVKLRLIQRLAETDTQTAMTMVEEARLDVLATVEEVRALAHGIYPPLLVDRGLFEALRAAAGRSALATTVDAQHLGRYPQDVEAAVYFCCLEAMQNAGKHAGEHAIITIRVEPDADGLRFEVIDTGAGFELADRDRGHGFVNMADRLGAFGGSVEVWSAPGQGTRISGRLPTSALTPDGDATVGPTPAD